MNAIGKLGVSAEIEVVRIEPGHDPRVVVRLAEVVGEGMRLRRPRAGETTALRVGESYRVDIMLDIPAEAEGKAATP